MNGQTYTMYYDAATRQGGPMGKLALEQIVQATLQGKDVAKVEEEAKAHFIVEVDQNTMVGRDPELVVQRSSRRWGFWPRWAFLPADSARAADRPGHRLDRPRRGDRRHRQPGDAGRGDGHGTDAGTARRSGSTGSTRPGMPPGGRGWTTGTGAAGNAGVRAGTHSEE